MPLNRNILLTIPITLSEQKAQAEISEDQTGQYRRQHGWHHRRQWGSGRSHLPDRNQSHHRYRRSYDNGHRRQVDSCGKLPMPSGHPLFTECRRHPYRCGGVSPACQQARGPKIMPAFCQFDYRVLRCRPRCRGHDRVRGRPDGAARIDLQGIPCR